MVTLKAPKLVDFVTDIFAPAGSSKDEAKRPLGINDTAIADASR